MTSLKEVLIKTGEKSEKAAAKSEEVVSKTNIEGREKVVKEGIEKGKAKHSDRRELHKKGEIREEKQKAYESKEMKEKSEIKQKLAIEKIKKEAFNKEKKTKVVMPPKKKKCNPISSLEKYVKKCKEKEEVFAKSKIANEKTVKSLELKVTQTAEMVKCKLTDKICKEITQVSTLRQEKINSMITDHDEELKKSVAKAEKLEAEGAAKMKFEICASAAKNMKYFAKKFLYGVDVL